MRDFFTELIDNLVILTGVDMYLIISADQMGRFKEELVNAGEVEPFCKIPDEVKKRIIMDRIESDPTFANPPYGRKPGLNRAILIRWYRDHWNTHGERLTQTAPTFRDSEQLYDEYVTLCVMNGTTPVSREDYLKVPSDERIQENATLFVKSLAAIEEPERSLGHELAKKFGKSVLPEYLAEKTNQNPQP